MVSDVGKSAREQSKLSSAWAKCERGSRHRADAFRTLSAWSAPLDKTFPAPVGRKDSVDGDTEIISYYITDPASNLIAPMEACLVVGDACNNYRAALDHLAWELVARAGATGFDPTKVYFPIAGSRTLFDRSVVAKLPGVSATLVSIIERYQPYANGAQAHRHPLRWLTEYVNTDKHRSVQVIASTSSNLTADQPANGFANFAVERLERAIDLEYLTPGTELLRIYGSRPNPEQNAGVRIHWKGLLWPTLENSIPIELMLGRIDDLVRSVLSEIERVLS